MTAFALLNWMFLLLQLYEISDEPKRKEFLDDLFIFMQKRGELMSELNYLSAVRWIECLEMRRRSLRGVITAWLISESTRIWPFLALIPLHLF